MPALQLASPPACSCLPIYSNCTSTARGIYFASIQLKKTTARCKINVRDCICICVHLPLAFMPAVYMFVVSVMVCFYELYERLSVLLYSFYVVALLARRWCCCCCICRVLVGKQVLDNTNKINISLFGFGLGSSNEC